MGKMNKYQEAFWNVERCLSDDHNFAQENLKIIEELVKKAIPKKPYIQDENEYVECPNCEFLLDNKKYCGQCGQAIDWSQNE